MPKDLFSRQAKTYAQYRPSYPEEMIQFILQFVDERHAAWDCATGNGQAALLLAAHFEKVYATDSSQGQIAQAIAHPIISYSVGKAEQTSFPDNFFDLVTVAQAYHWLQPEAFGGEVKRVGKAGAVVAVWGYNIPFCMHDNIDQLIISFYKDTIGPYWDPERKHVETSYQNLPFAFEEMPAPVFSHLVEWSRHDLIGYLNSWSAVQHFTRINQRNPVEDFAGLLDQHWPPDNRLLPFEFPIFLRLGYVRK